VSAKESRTVRVGKRRHRHEKEGGENAATHDPMRTIRNHPDPRGRLIHKLGWSHQRPEPHAPERDEQRVAGCMVTGEVGDLLRRRLRHPRGLLRTARAPSDEGAGAMRDVDLSRCHLRLEAPWTGPGVDVWAGPTPGGSPPCPGHFRSVRTDDFTTAREDSKPC